jgi:hypothetical protein
VKLNYRNTVKKSFIFWGEEKKWRILINGICDIKIIAAVNNKYLNIR